MPTPAPNLLLSFLMDLTANKDVEQVALKQAHAYALLQDKAVAEATWAVVKQAVALEDLGVQLHAAGACTDNAERRENHLKQKLADGFDIVAFAEECHANSVAHGWHDKDKSFGDYIALMHSELSEALEAFREPLPWQHRLFHLKSELQADPLATKKPEGILSELADVIIRIFDYTGSIHASGQLIEAMKLKHDYNKTRPHRHGGKLL